MGYQFGSRFWNEKLLFHILTVLLPTTDDINLWQDIDHVNGRLTWFFRVTWSPHEPRW